MADHDEDSRTATVGRKRPREQDVSAQPTPLPASPQEEDASSAVKRQRLAFGEVPPQESREIISIDSDSSDAGEDAYSPPPAMGQDCRTVPSRRDHSKDGFPHLSSASTMRSQGSEFTPINPEHQRSLRLQKEPVADLVDERDMDSSASDAPEDDSTSAGQVKHTASELEEVEAHEKRRAKAFARTFSKKRTGNAMAREAALMVGRALQGSEPVRDKTCLRSFAKWLGETAGSGLVGIWIAPSTPDHSRIVLQYESALEVESLKEALQRDPPVHQTNQQIPKSKQPIIPIHFADSHLNGIWAQGHPSKVSLSDTFANSFASARVSRVKELLESGRMRFKDYKSASYTIPPSAGQESEAAPNGQSETPFMSASGAPMSAKVPSDKGGTMSSGSPQGGPYHLGQLSPEEALLQVRYFGAVDGDGPVHCLTCADEGHISDHCPARRCAHCHSVDVHFSSSCPQVLKCTKCREHGHEWIDCPSKLARSKADGFLCDMCKGTGHVEEECSMLWRTFDPAKIADLKRVDRIPAWCYECGAEMHWGDDCRLAKSRLVKVGTFSAEEASKYSRLPIPQPSQGSRGFSIKGRADQPISIDSEEEDDDLGNFVGKKPRRAARGGIRINTGSSLGGVGPMNRLGPQGPGNPMASSYHGGSQGGWQPPLPDEPPPPPPPRAPSRGGFGSGSGRGGDQGYGRGRGDGRGRGRGRGGGRGGGVGRGGGFNSVPPPQELVAPPRKSGGGKKKKKKRGNGNG